MFDLGAFGIAFCLSLLIPERRANACQQQIVIEWFFDGSY
jgi:hypothetical protein